jgi:arylsulfatase A-like enzyme
MMSAVDDGVGRILDALDRRGIRDTTFIVLLSDNGAPTRVNASLNTPLRGQKGDVWEGGVRIPFLLSWPAKIAPGQIRDVPVCSIDLMPTFLSAAGVEVGEAFDGVDLFPWLTDGAAGMSRERLFFWRAGRRAVRAGDLKLSNSQLGPKAELFNLRDNFGEDSTRALDKPGMRMALAGEIEAWEASWAPPLPRPDGAPDDE